jgi:hypothetical protein
MFTKSRSRWGLLALVAALSLAFVAMTTASAIVVPAGTLSLHVADGVGVFTYDPTSGSNVTQTLTPDRCGLGTTVNGTLGVKSGGATGTPCGRVDTTEDMSLALDNVPNAISVELDLELKGNANFKIELKLGGTSLGIYEVRSGSSIVAGQGVEGTTTPPFTVSLTDTARIGNCRNASDSGPDSGGNDNCRISIVPSGEFDTVVFLQPLVGEFSLEGGGDAGTSDTVFNLVESFEGELGCTDENNEATDVVGSVAGTIIRHENTDHTDCVLKPYNLTASESDEDGDPSITFDVADPVDPPQAAAYEAYLTFDQALTNPLSATLTYDDTAPYDTFEDMPPCVADPFALDGDDATGSINDEAIPSGDTACVVDVSQDWDGTTIWHIVFTADIRFK